MGKGNVDGGVVTDISWAREFQSRLEMDLFDPSFVGPVVQELRETADPEKQLPLLKRLFFMILSCKSVAFA